MHYWLIRWKKAYFNWNTSCLSIKTFTIIILCQERDDLINPFWIEDRDLGRGEVDYLSGAEIQFWKDLIEKYLHPIDADKTKQVGTYFSISTIKKIWYFVFYIVLKTTKLIACKKEVCYTYWFFASLRSFSANFLQSKTFIFVCVERKKKKLVLKRLKMVWYGLVVSNFCSKYFFAAFF